MASGGAILNQYTEQQVAFWIDGYYGVSPERPETRTPESAFALAKQTAIDAMLRHVAEIESMTCERWHAMKAGGI